MVKSKIHGADGFEGSNVPSVVEGNATNICISREDGVEKWNKIWLDLHLEELCILNDAEIC